MDYKAGSSWDEKDKKACCNIVKDILAMANTLGGILFIGVAETAAGWDLTGLTDEQAKTWDVSRVSRFVNNYADPPVNFHVRKLTDNGKVFVAIEVPPFQGVPHLCTKDYPQVLSSPTLYVRTANNESAPIASSADFRSVIEHAVRNQQDAIVRAVQSVLSQRSTSPEPRAKELFGIQVQSSRSRFDELAPLGNKQYTMFREGLAFPATFTPNTYAASQLRPAIEASRITYRGWPLLYLGNGSQIGILDDYLEGLVASTLMRDIIDFWRLYQSGMFYHRSLMWEQQGAREKRWPPEAVGVGSTLFYIAEYLDGVVRVFSNLGMDDEAIVTVEVALTGVKGKVLKVEDPNRTPLFEDYTSLSNRIAEQRTTTLGVLRADLTETAVQMMVSVCARFNWNPEPGTVDQFRTDVANLFARKL